MTRYVEQLIHTSTSSYLNTSSACPILKIPKGSGSYDNVTQFKVKQVDYKNKGTLESTFVFCTGTTGHKLYCNEENGFKFRAFAGLYQNFYYIFIYPFANNSFVVLDIDYETNPNFAQPIINGVFNGDTSTKGYAFFSGNVNFESVIQAVLNPYMSRTGLTNGTSATGQMAHMITLRTGGNSKSFDRCIEFTLNELQHISKTGSSTYGKVLLTTKYTSSTWTAKFEILQAFNKFTVSDLNVYAIPDSKDLKIYVKPATTFTQFETLVTRGQTIVDEYILVNDGCAWETGVVTTGAVATLF